MVTEMAFLRRCVELATEALEAGENPFGSLLVDGDGNVLAEDHNRVSGGDHERQHPSDGMAVREQDSERRHDVPR